MHRRFSVLAITGLIAFSAPALADTTTTTLSPANTQNNNSNATSTPYASNSQVNIQNAYNGVVGTGAGYTCPTTSFSVGVANTSFTNPGFNGSSATSVYGTLNVPFNSGGALTTCRDRAKVDLAIAQTNLTAGRITECAQWRKDGLDLNSPKLRAFGCGDLVAEAPPVQAAAMAAPPPAPPAPAPVAYRHLSNFAPPACVDDTQRDADLVRLRAHRNELRGKHQSLATIKLHEKLSHACNVTSAQILSALDG